MMVNRIAICTIIFIVSVSTVFTTNLPKNEHVPDAAANKVEIENYEPFVVLELFTSQGCSSCPPADALLEKVKKDFSEVVFPLSYHVDYWNYIGWEDPFSQTKNTRKQQAYNLKFGNKSNYTPQIVVNGKEHFVGSSSVKLLDAIDKYKKQGTTNQIQLSNIVGNGNSVSFDFEVMGGIKNKNLRAVLVLDHRITEVERGENRNRKLTNSNIVVGEKIMAVSNSKSESFISIPELVKSNEPLSLFLLLENADFDISAAAKGVVKRD